MASTRCSLDRQAAFRAQHSPQSYSLAHLPAAGPLRLHYPHPPTPRGCSAAVFPDWNAVPRPSASPQVALRVSPRGLKTTGPGRSVQHCPPAAILPLPHPHSNSACILYLKTILYYFWKKSLRQLVNWITFLLLCLKFSIRHQYPAFIQEGR